MEKIKAFIKENRKEILLFIFFALAAAVLTTIVYFCHSYPLGVDTYGHMANVNSLYKGIINGHPYVVYRMNWYSGTEVFRFWVPMSFYFCCIFMLLTGGNIYVSYLCFVYSMFLIGASGFILFAKREKRYKLAAALGIIYMLLPDNIRVLFVDGNMPRIFITAFLPYLFFFICEVIRYNNRKALKAIYLLSAFIVCSHIMISALVGLSCFMLLLFYGLANKELKKELVVLFCMGLGYMTAGIALLPSVMDGLVIGDNAASHESSVAMWSSKASDSLSPILRFTRYDQFYFGIVFFVLVLFGVLCMRKKLFAFFFTPLVIFIGTTIIIRPLINLIPMSQVLWMTRFVPMAYCLILIGFMYWRELKRGVIIAFAMLMFADGLVSFGIGQKDNDAIAQREQELSNQYFLREACELTKNQLSIMDLSSLGSYPAWLISEEYNKRYLFGWAFQGSYTMEEIVQLNEAFERGYYDYMFDRLAKYGCDTVVIKKSEIKRDYEGMLQALKRSEYEIVKENEYALLINNGATQEYGVVTRYENVCIGTGSESISYMYPSFYKLREDKLDAYTFEDLKDYKKIFLSGPEYTDKEYAEALIRQLAEHGVKIYVDMSNLVEDLGRGRDSFLGVVAQPIVFNDNFPILEMKNGSQFKLPSHANFYEEWRTVYFTNIGNVEKYAEYKRKDKIKHLAYLGSSTDGNIVYIGFNLVYYCYVTHNAQLYRFLDEIIEEGHSDAALHEKANITTQLDNNRLIINSDADKVMVGLANLKSFKTDKELGSETFINVNKGETKIEVEHAYLTEGLTLSIIGLILFINIYLIIRQYSFWVFGTN